MFDTQYVCLAIYHLRVRVCVFVQHKAYGASNQQQCGQIPLIEDKWDLVKQRKRKTTSRPNFESHADFKLSASFTSQEVDLDEHLLKDSFGTCSMRAGTISYLVHHPSTLCTYISPMRHANI